VEGVDVSNWQGTINWTSVASTGKKFAFLKATEGTAFLDAYYAANYAGAKAAGLRVGAYAFAQPAVATSIAVTEADWFVTNARLVKGDLPPVLDLEITNGLTVAQLHAWVQAYVDEIFAKTGYRTMIYVSPSFWSTNLGDSAWLAQNGYPLLWIAHWTSAAQPTVPASNWNGYGWTFWQYTSGGTVAGISGRVDIDRFVGSDLSTVALK
jgi:GH25 family lysozyme M1 (1,4-beta-N-acetylmuramidase)